MSSTRMEARSRQTASGPKTRQEESGAELNGYAEMERLQNGSSHLCELWPWDLRLVVRLINTMAFYFIDDLLLLDLNAYLRLLGEEIAKLIVEDLVADCAEKRRTIEELYNQALLNGRTRIKRGMLVTAGWVIMEWLFKLMLRVLGKSP